MKGSGARAGTDDLDGERVAVLAMLNALRNLPTETPMGDPIEPPPETLIVMLGVPFAALGAIWLLYFAAFNTSIAVWVGMIAPLGVAAETTSVMIVYLDDAWNEGRRSGRIVDVPSLIRASVDAGSQRVRPLLMTVMTNIFGLLPVLIDTGVGADVAKRIAAPMWGGLISLTLLLVVDDRANMLQLLQKVLGADANVFTAQSGADAIALLESRPVAAVVCDLRLPDLSGIDGASDAETPSKVEGDDDP